MVGLFWFVGVFFSKAQVAEFETTSLVKIEDKCIFYCEYTIL